MILSICPNPSVDKYIRLSSVEPGKVNKSSGEMAFPGGKGVHVGLAIKELGNDSHITGFWGGPTGNWVKQACNSLGVECSGPNLEQWTRTCLTLQSEGRWRETEILETGPCVNTDEIQLFQDLINQKITQSDAVCICGSWPPGTDRDIYNFFRKYCDQKFPVWIDASGDWLKQAVKIHPHGLHINRSEAESFLGRSGEPARLAKDLLNFCNIAAVTDGENGLYLASDNLVIHARCRVEKVISTVGCGDCLLAGLIHAESKGQSLEIMAKTGTACGAANCLRPELGMLYKYDADRLMDQVVIKKYALQDI